MTKRDMITKSRSKYMSAFLAMLGLMIGCATCIIGLVTDKTWPWALSLLALGTLLSWVARITWNWRMS
jgi:hypothetical protein